MNSLHVQQLKTFLEENAARRPVLLDVREASEVAAAPLITDGAEMVHMPMHLVPLRRTELDPERPVVVFCHSGGRSAQVVAFLSHHGHPQAYNLAGGICAWMSHSATLA